MDEHVSMDWHGISAGATQFVHSFFFVFFFHLMKLVDDGRWVADGQADMGHPLIIQSLLDGQYKCTNGMDHRLCEWLAHLNEE